MMMKGVYSRMYLRWGAWAAWSMTCGRGEGPRVRTRGGAGEKPGERAGREGARATGGARDEEDEPNLEVAHRVDVVASKAAQLVREARRVRTDESHALQVHRLAVDGGIIARRPAAAAPQPLDPVVVEGVESIGQPLQLAREEEHRERQHERRELQDVLQRLRTSGEGQEWSWRGRGALQRACGFRVSSPNPLCSTPPVAHLPDKGLAAHDGARVEALQPSTSSPADGAVGRAPERARQRDTLGLRHGPRRC